jgi:hypothetical protein
MLEALSSSVVSTMLRALTHARVFGMAIGRFSIVGLASIMISRLLPAEGRASV